MTTDGLENGRDICHSFAVTDTYSFLSNPCTFSSGKRLP